jgi:hypothetical protein
MRVGYITVVLLLVYIKNKLKLLLPNIKPYYYL